MNLKDKSNKYLLSLNMSNTSKNKLCILYTHHNHNIQDYKDMMMNSIQMFDLNQPNSWYIWFYYLYNLNNYNDIFDIKEDQHHNNPRHTNIKFQPMFSNNYCYMINTKLLSYYRFDSLLNTADIQNYHYHSIHLNRHMSCLLNFFLSQTNNSCNYINFLYNHSINNYTRHKQIHVHQNILSSKNKYQANQIVVSSNQVYKKYNWLQN